MNETQIIEINGVKMEIDMRHAKVMQENIRVGTRVKLLMRESLYGSGNKTTKVFPGVVVGFEPFKDLPTIIVCYLEHSYSEANLKFAYVNSDSQEKYDMIVSVDDELPIAKADVVSKIEREVDRKREEIADLEMKRDYFLRHFNRWFEATASAGS